MADARVPRETILGMHIDALSYDGAVQRIATWCQEFQHCRAEPRRKGRYVCVASVNMVMEAWDHSAVRAAVNAADLVVPDGMPLVWYLRHNGHNVRSNVRGTTLTFKLCQWAAQNGVAVGFFGGAPGIADAAVKNLKRRVPHLNVTYVESPPYFTEPLLNEELVTKINKSCAMLFVGLGCPKQELWMSLYSRQLQAVLLGVGAAFDFHAGALREAPKWMQERGLEWMFRLASEPKRLWRRYLIKNPRFLFYLARYGSGLGSGR